MKFLIGMRGDDSAVLVTGNIETPSLDELQRGNPRELYLIGHAYNLDETLLKKLKGTPEGWFPKAPGLLNQFTKEKQIV